MQTSTVIHKTKQRLLFPIYLNWANGRLERGNYVQSVNDCDRAITLTPHRPEPYLIRAKCRIHLGELTNARTDYETVLQLNQTESNAYIGLGNIAYLEQDYPEAIRCYNLAIYYTPDCAHAYYNRGLVASTLKQYDNALADYTQSLYLEPAYTFVYLNRAEVYFITGDYASALEDFQHAHRQTPHLRRAIAGMAVAFHALGQRVRAISLWQELMMQNSGYEDAAWVEHEHAWDPILTHEVQGLLADLQTD